jgi:ankyrin repeat protein
MLVGATVDIDHQTKAGNTALILAAFFGDDNLLQILISAHAAPNAHNAKGTTALMMASMNGHVECARMLIEAGADPGIVDANMKSARDFAVGAGHGKLVETLKLK